LNPTPPCTAGTIEIVNPIRFAEKRIYHDCRTDESSDSDDRTRSSRPAVNISAFPCSYQSRSQSVVWSHDTSSRNKIRQRSSFEVGRHMWCQPWALLGGTTNSISAIPLLPPSSSARIGARSEGVCIKLLTLPGKRRRTLVRNALCGIPIGSGVDDETQSAIKKFASCRHLQRTED
jgi:hypothetical protein